MRKLVICVICMGLCTAPHGLFGYGTTSSMPTTPSTSSSSSSSSSKIPAAAQKIEKLNVNIDALRSQLQQRNQNASQRYQTQNQTRRHAAVQPVDTWEHTTKAPQ